ncbi:Prominin-like protein, partial [Gryllus bimaculatus]
MCVHGLCLRPQLAAARRGRAARRARGAGGWSAAHSQSSVRRRRGRAAGRRGAWTTRGARRAAAAAPLDDWARPWTTTTASWAAPSPSVARRSSAAPTRRSSHLDAPLAPTSRYRYYADAGASAALLLVVLLLALGLLYGFCGKAPLPGDALGAYGGEDCCARATGARWLMLAVAAMFLLGSALALAALVHFAAGLAAQQAVCAPLRPAPRPAPLLALADAWLAPPEERAALPAAGGGPPRDGKRWPTPRRLHRTAAPTPCSGSPPDTNAQELPGSRTRQ